MRSLFFFCILLSLPLHAFPAIPASTRILTAKEVQNFWFNYYRRLPLPPKPNGLHPEQLPAWRSAVNKRTSLLKKLHAGEYYQKAQLIALRHNIDAYQKLGKQEQVQSLSSELRLFELHQAQMNMTKAQTQKAEAEAAAAEQVGKAAQAVEAAAKQSSQNHYQLKCEHH